MKPREVVAEWPIDEGAVIVLARVTHDNRRSVRIEWGTNRGPGSEWDTHRAEKVVAGLNAAIGWLKEYRP